MEWWNELPKYPYDHHLTSNIISSWPVLLPLLIHLLRLPATVCLRRQSLAWSLLTPTWLHRSRPCAWNSPYQEIKSPGILYWAYRLLPCVRMFPYVRLLEYSFVLLKYVHQWPSGMHHPPLPHPCLSISYSTEEGVGSFHSERGACGTNALHWLMGEARWPWETNMHSWSWYRCFYFVSKCCSIQYFPWQLRHHDAMGRTVWSPTLNW